MVNTLHSDYDRCIIMSVTIVEWKILNFLTGEESSA